MNFTHRKEFALSNTHCDFMRDLVVIPSLPGVLDVNILGSHARERIDWEPIPAKKYATDAQYRFEFEKPLAYAHYFIELVGNFAADIEIETRFDPVRPVAPSDIKTKLKNKSISFVGCARNCLSSLKSTIELIHALGSNFGYFSLHIFENDSADGTKEYLFDCEKQGLLKLSCATGLDKIFPLRSQRLAYARNLLHQTVLSESPDFFCVCDLDGIIGDRVEEITDAFLANFNFEDCWDAVFPVHRSRYYDLWALRHDVLMPDDFNLLMMSAPRVMDEAEMLKFYVQSVTKIDFTALRGWLEVESAFGGMGIYKTEMFRHSSYFGVHRGLEICEHVPFHETARGYGAKLYINPGFVIG
jgi:hypothetical protein